MTNTRRIASNTIVQIISRILTAGISLVAVGYLTRYLGVEGYGQYSLITAYLGLFGVVVDFGFFLLQVRAVVANPGREGFVLGNFLSLKILLAIIAFGLAFIIARLTFSDPLIFQGILIGAISQASMSFLHIPTSLFQARLQMQVIAAANVLSRLLYAVAIVGAVFYARPLLDFVWLVSLINLLHFVVMMVVTYRLIRIRLEWDWGYIRSIVIDSIPIGLATVLAMLYFRIDTVMLGYMTNSYAVGIYSAPYKILDVFLTIPVIFMSSVFPIMTQAFAQGHEHLQRIFSKAINYSTILAGPILAGGFVLAGPIIGIIAGSGYEAATPVLQILIWVTTLSFFGAVFTYTVIAAGKQQLLVWPYVAATIFNVATNYLLIPHFSYTGASYTTVATELIVVLMAGYITSRYLRLGISTKSALYSILATLLMGLVMWPLRQYNFIAVGSLGCLVYLGVLVATKTLPISVIKHLVKR